MDDQDGIGIEMQRVDPALMREVLLEQQQARKSKRTEWQRHWTLIPRAWEQRLLRAKRISTYRLAIELLYLHWYGKGKAVTVSGKVAKAVNISATSKWEALAELEQLGLIDVDRTPCKAPRVVLRHTQVPKT